MPSGNGARGGSAAHSGGHPDSGTWSVADPPPERFLDRHIGPRPSEILQMLEALGLGGRAPAGGDPVVSGLAALVDAAMPDSIRTPRPLALDPPLGERECIARLRQMAARNRPLVSCIGMGYHGTVTPPVIQRNVLEDPGWYTAYTPYQAEVSQGRLEALLTFQQMVMDLTGLDLANASLLDEATAAAEAMTMSRRISRAPGNVFVVDADCHPQTIAVVRTRARPLGYEVLVDPDPVAAAAGSECFGVLTQYPGSCGRLRPLSPVAEAAHARGALLVVAADLLALALVEPPGEAGADIVVGSSQRFGVPMGYGGPHAAYLATRYAYRRQTPGRIIGVSVDAHGRPALRMALQTREQHIRREKATSNICTAQVLLAVVAAMWAVYHGPKGVRAIAERVHRHAVRLAEGLRAMGVDAPGEGFFDTVTARVPGRADAVLARAREAGINLRRVDGDRVGVTFDETTTGAVVASVLDAFAAALEAPSLRPPDEASRRPSAEAIPESLRRRSPYLTHPVFNRYHSETEMLRYLRRLSERDIALDRAMIPLGSCTMKLNATTEMLPVSWPELADMHPFAPREQAAGYHELIADLERMLCECTGFDAFSMQPNAGSQGEYTGLLVIRRYHESRGEGGREVCLIPASAHGTNPASARMAGLQVVEVACDEAGNIDIDDLRLRAEEAGPRLAALMVTYPSTHGVFEPGIREICEVVHAQGGQVYLDGANLNALLGHARPAELGADVSHINLHKTFCIPHGGGGPGMGPIGVRAHLAPFLPGHPVVEGVNPHDRGEAIGAVSAAPWGSPLILPISWAYIAMMGAEGLARATAVAILNANYVARRLGGAYPVLFTGPGGFVAHECIIDLRDLRKAAGVGVVDVAKRLIDYGFHAPTVSFPVHETMMIEPTESEGKGEIDRFCEAMIAIREEIRAIERGEAGQDSNPLRNAPHCPAALLVGEWRLPYAPERAFYPAPETLADKYWPPVGRVDEVRGDRELRPGWGAAGSTGGGSSPDS